MQLAKKLVTDKDGVYVVAGLGNHELGINDKRDSDTAMLTKYITKLKEYVSSDKFHVINTGLPWKNTEPISDLYGKEIETSVTINNITFISIVGYSPYKEDAYKYKKSKFYGGTVLSKSNYDTQIVDKINDINITLSPPSEGLKPSIVLMAHGGFPSIHPILKSVNLGQGTYVITGHNHNEGFMTPSDGHYDSLVDNKIIREQLQPDPFGLGYAVLYAKPDGTWLHQSNLEKTGVNQIYETIDGGIITAPEYLFTLGTVYDQDNTTINNQSCNGYLLTVSDDLLDIEWLSEQETVSEDTGSGHYSEYPRSVDDGGKVLFGTSPTVLSVDLPKGTTGSVILVAESKTPAPDGKNTYKVFEINVQNYPKGESALIQFKLTVSEIEKAGYKPEDVCLYHCDSQGVWKALPTSFKIVNGEVYYEAETTEFSPFAVVYEKGSAISAVTPVPTVISSVSTPAEILPTYVEPTMPATTAKPRQTESSFALIGLVSGLAASVAVLRRK